MRHVPADGGSIRRRWRLLCTARACLAAGSVCKIAVGGRGIGETFVTEVGYKAGLFKKHNLVLDIFYTDGGGETQQAVISNSAQIGIASGFLGAIGVFAKGAPVRIIGGSYTGGAQVFWYRAGRLRRSRRRRTSPARPSAIRPTARRRMPACSRCRSTTTSISSRRDRQRRRHHDGGHERAGRCRLGRCAVRRRRARSRQDPR